jgi:hypothetical protein
MNIAVKPLFGIPDDFPQHQALDIETFGSGVFRQKLAGVPPITLSRFPDTNRSTVDCWYTACERAILECRDPVFYAIHDFSSPDISITPYSRSRAKELYHLRTDLYVLTAIYMPKNLSTQLIRMFTRQNQVPHMQTEVVFSIQQALLWFARIHKKGSVPTAI